MPFKTGKPICKNSKKQFLDLWAKTLKQLPTHKRCLILRDYHAENMMLVNKNGTQSIGLLDFQDAIIGDPIYDLVSLLEDARYRSRFRFCS
ncbi:MAG: phosphotransferase [Janthinobacterium lividum]